MSVLSDTDYLIYATGQVTATGLAHMLGGDVSHDKIVRCLSEGKYDSKSLWKEVKPMAEELCRGSENVFLIFDDSIEEKRYENDVICWHYDHVFQRNVKVVNFLTALLDIGDARLGLLLFCS